MSRLSSRALTTLVAAQLLLAGCGQTPVGAKLGTTAAPAAPVAAAAATVTPQGPSATVALAPSLTTTKGAAPAAAPAPVAPLTAGKPVASGLFDHDYNPADVTKYAAQSTDPETDAAIKQDMSAEGVGMANPGAIGGSWGMIGGIALAALGIPAIGYAIYAGSVGSHDLMYPSDMETLRKDPSQYGWAYEPDYFETADKLKLVAWYVPAEVPTTKGILMLHGHTSDMDRCLQKYGAMLHHDYNMYFYDSRFHGDSEGKFTTLGYYERNDALLALQRMRDRGNTSIGVMGESMGGAVAIEATAMDPTVKACWSDCPFDSLWDAVAPRATKRGYPFPNYVAFCVVETCSIRAKGNLMKADPINWVAKISPRPLQLIHGQADDDTTPMNSEKLFDKAGEPKAIWRTPNTKHASSWETFPDEYKARIQTFFRNAL